MKLTDHAKMADWGLEHLIFPNMGHGTLAGEYPEQFLQEVQSAHQRSLKKEKL